MWGESSEWTFLKGFVQKIFCTPKIPRGGCRLRTLSEKCEKKKREKKNCKMTASLSVLFICHLYWRIVKETPQRPPPYTFFSAKPEGYLHPHLFSLKEGSGTKARRGFLLCCVDNHLRTHLGLIGSVLNIGRGGKKKNTNTYSVGGSSLAQAFDPDTASDHVFLLFYVGGSTPLQGSGDSFPVLVTRSTQTVYPFLKR